MIDFSECETTDSVFSGSERKIGVLYHGDEYMLKFQSRDAFGERFNHVSEHVGSSTFNLLGVKAQKTVLGTYHGRNVVACRLFGSRYEQFVPFDDVGESSLDHVGRTPYSYDGITTLLKANRKLTGLDETIEHFWNMYVVDALLGNFDRHGSNWGFLKRDNRYTVAPVFDNGSCLYPRMSDETMMSRVIGSEELTDERVYRYPSSQIKLDGGRSTYFDVIGSMRFEDCNSALVRICERLDMEKVYDLVRGLEGVSDVHKEFYTHMLHARYSKILRATYERMRR